jgi:hypothetical protein
MTIIDTCLDPSAEFTVTGSEVITVAVRGAIDRGAFRGFDAVVDWLTSVRGW